jgi:dihydroorotase
MNSLCIARPDDWHLHLRDDAALQSVVGFTAQRFARAIVMPNLNPPVTTTPMAVDYRRRILAALPTSSRFEPLMTLYLTDTTPASEIDAARRSGVVHAVKYYPAGATTHADAGVTDIRRVFAALARMEELGLPLLVHGEVTDRDVDIFERESRFIDTTLAVITDRFKRLKIVVEHITTARAVDFVHSARVGIAATITPQHLLHNRNALFHGGLRPHYYCLPILKTERDRMALLTAAISGNPKFFLGTDSAPHERKTKEHACGCAGMFTAHAGIELYAEAFDSAGRLDRLEAFASHFGADFYGLPRNVEKITLIESPWTPPASYPFAGGELVPYGAGETLRFRLADAVKP